MLLTKGGFESLQTELTELRDSKRPKLVERLAHARSQGDLSENSDYISAREELEFLDGRISELEMVLKKATLATTNTVGEVGVGTKVTVSLGGKEVIFEIVGDWEADPLNKKVSAESPLGKALLGKNKGDSVEVEAPAGKIVYKIVSIE